MSKVRNQNGYPRSRLTLVKGKQYVIVSVPADLRHLFPNQRDKRLSTGTSDLNIAQLKQHDLAQQIYDGFDSKIKESAVKLEVAGDGFALDVIGQLATAFNHRTIPALKPSTNYQELVAFKNSCDVYSEMPFNATSDEDGSAMLAWLAANPKPDPIDLIAMARAMQKRSGYTNEQNNYAAKYQTHFVHNFWQDLLITTAREQNLPEPKIEPFKGVNENYVLQDDDRVLPDNPVSRHMHEEMLKEYIPKLDGRFDKPISRPPRVQPFGARTVSTVMVEYLDDMRLKQDSLDTQRKLKRWAKKFLDMMGDMEIAKIKPAHGFEYITKVLSEYPTQANKTLKDYLWGVQNLLKFCRERGYIDINPFVNLDISKYGKASEETLPYSNEEIKIILAHDWKPQERLLLSILATTGMRPSEAGNMTWERFNDTEHKGIRFLSTLDTDTEQVRVKNQSSKRQVPLHPDLVLPKKGAGRLFDYKKDEDGRCSTDIAHEINPILEQLVPHPNKSLRSFRKTFKITMRDAGVGEEVHDAITGHRQGDTTGRKNYGGMGLKVKFKAISKLDISFLGSTV
jgi:integrase